MSAHEHSRDDAAAYALGALEPQEAEAFRRHMSECAICRDDVAAFREAVDTLPGAAPQLRAPRALRREIVGTVREDAKKRQLPASRRRGLLPSLRPSPWTAAALGVAAAAVIALIVVSVTGGSSGARIVNASVGSAAVRVSGTRAELIVHHLPSPPPGQIYELWVRHGDRTPQPTNTLFSVNTRGTADVGVPGGVHGVSAVLVTAEPAGGTEVPTTTPVIVAQLS